MRAGSRSSLYAGVKSLLWARRCAHPPRNLSVEPRVVSWRAAVFLAQILWMAEAGRFTGAQMDVKTVLVELLLAGFFAVACFRARPTAAAGQRVTLGSFLHFTKRLESLQTSPWQC